MAAAHFTAGNDLQALEWAEQALQGRPDHFPALSWAAAAAAQLGLQAKAEGFKDRALRDIPGLSLDYMANIIPYQVPEHAARLSEGFRKAGFPG